MRALDKLGNAKGVADAVAAVRALLSQLLDAFVALIAPLAARLGTRERSIAVFADGVLTLHRARGRGPVEKIGVLESGADADSRSSHPHPHPEVPRSGLEGGLEKPRQSLEGSFEARLRLAPQDEREGGRRNRTRAGRGPEGPRGPIDLRLPAELFLRRTLVLPDVGRDYLEPILAHRLERLTPWRPDRVRYGFRIEPGKAADGTITVELLVIAVERVAPLIARLEAAGLSVENLGSAADPLDAPPRIDLFRERRRGSDARLRRVVSVCTAGALAVLVPAVLLTGWLADAAESELAATQDRLATLQRHIRAARGEAGSRERALIEAKRVETSTLTLLHRLSAALPDHTVLRELDIGTDKVRLVGRSGDAAALIGQLEGQADLAAVHFAAPVTRDAERQDLFDIAAHRPAGSGRESGREK